MPTKQSKQDDRPAFYLTTPIYYVNARPHLGHAYTSIAADTLARWKRMRGFDVHFLTGTDEHGQKIERSAARTGKTPGEFAAEISGEFRALWDRMGLTYDDFIRTTEDRHKRGSQELFRELKKRGYIYKGTYSGQYCVWDELYVEGPPGTVCPDCGRLTETVSEENYFFKLSAFERKLLEYYDEHPDFIRPETRRNEVIAFVRGGLRDLSISRTSFNWGIPVPDDEAHVIYVWMDALANYITALGYGSNDRALLDRYWPADLHLIGKEISRFHCVYWPAFLMAAGLPLPKSVVAHGWLLFEHSKMSKSRGNIVRAETVLDVLGVDALRYFLLREIVFGQDGSFSFDSLVRRYNADLANGYGNLVSRTLAMIEKYFDGAVPAGSDPEIQKEVEDVIEKVPGCFNQLDFSDALYQIWSAIARIDGYITASAPWKPAEGLSAEENKTRLARILYTCAESIRLITALACPVIPDAAAKVWQQLGLGDIAQADLKNLQWGGLKPGTKLGALGAVFPRAEKDAVERMQAMENERAAQTTVETAEEDHSAGQAETKNPTSTSDPTLASHPIEQKPLAGDPDSRTLRQAPQGTQAKHQPSSAASHPVEPKSLQGTQGNQGAKDVAVPTEHPKISIDDFAKVELRVAVIRVAERIPKADRLLRLEVDLGYEQRQILAGIAEAYTPESLIGRKVVIVANLAPRKLRGLESNGMVVAASLGEKGKPVLAGFLEDVEIGSRLK